MKVCSFPFYLKTFHPALETGHLSVSVASFHHRVQVPVTIGVSEGFTREVGG